MFDAVGASIDRRRAAIAVRRAKRSDRTKGKNKRRRRNNVCGRSLFDRERILLDRPGKKADRHRAAIDVAAIRGECWRIVLLAFGAAMSREFLERTMIGRSLRLFHRPAIGHTGRTRTVQANEYRNEES